MQYIFIHGLGQNSSSWNKTVSHLKQQDIICPELFEFLKDRECTYANLYEVFSEYCNEFSEPVNLCGLSLGAVIALNYAADHPERVNSLILIAGQYEMPKMLLKLQNVIFRFMPESSFKNMGFKKQDFMKLTSSMADLNFSKSLKSISCRTLIVCGEKDSANKKASVNIAESITKSEIQFIDNSGHEVNVDAPEKLADIIDDFYKRSSYRHEY